MERSLASARLAVLESVGFSLGLMTGTRTPGRRPDRMAEAYPELQSLVLKLLRENSEIKAHDRLSETLLDPFQSYEIKQTRISQRR